MEDLVLLDENLLKGLWLGNGSEWLVCEFQNCVCLFFTLHAFAASNESPLYIRPHSKTVLTLAITNDTQFLSSNLVMDYSLLVGLDEETKELVVGIIGEIHVSVLK